jgi:hypothetical protein
MKILNKATILAAAFGAAGALQTAQASLGVDYGTSTTLANLINGGGYLSVGDKTFTGFNWYATGDNSSVVSALNNQAAQLLVSVFIGGDGVYYLDYGGAIGVNNLQGTASLMGDLKLYYTVTANPGSIVMIDQNYTPNVTGQSPGDAISIGETVKTPGGVIVGNSTLTLSDLSDPAAEAGDNLNFDPQHQLIVTKDILMIAGAGDFVGLSDVQQSFHQTAVPEPSTVVAGALLLLPFGVSTLRILRKNKVS